jgi:hypothetical protein
MNAEDRIIELLAEYLQKTDRLLDRMEKTDRNVDTMSKAIADHSLKFIEMNGKFNEMSARFNARFDEMKEEQGIMLKELLSISRRVATLEDKP